MNYDQDWEDYIGNDLRKEIEENNADIRAKIARSEADLKHALEQNPNLPLDEQIKISPRAFGVWL